MVATIAAVLSGSQNYFALFDLPVGFDVDPSRLTGRYRALLDPDLPASIPIEQPPTEIELAYRTLADPLARAAYLLDLLGPHTRDPNELVGFLMAQMELRESLAEATSSPDPSTSVANVLTQLAEQGASLAKELQRLLAEPSPKNLAAAREILRQLELVGTCRRDAEDQRAALALEP
jgi:molecular chaperone HscB